MNQFQKIRSCFRALFGQRKLDLEMDEEMRAHIEMRKQANIDAGMESDEARRAALREFGTAESLKETCRDERRVAWLEDFAQDVRFGLRMFFKNPGFTFIAVVTLALGIGANTAIFSVVNALLFRPLPFRDPERLVWIQNGGPMDTGLSDQTTRVANFREWREQNHSFESLGAYFAFFDYSGYTLSSDGEPLRLQAAAISQNLLDVLGVKLQLGNGFTEEECRWQGPPAVLLTDAFWKRRFNGRPEIVGQTITLNNAATRVAGVLPPPFDFSSIFAPGSHVDIVGPFPIADETDHWGNTLSIIGRLKPGVKVETAQAEFDLILKRQHQDHADRGAFFAQLTPLSKKINGQFRRAFLILFGAVGCVLLIACANVSNLLLARAMARRKEIAVRLAVGATRSRLIRQMLAESCLLAGTGAALGLPLAAAFSNAMASSRAFNIALLQTVSLDRTALIFTLALAVLSALLFGAIPALHVSSEHLQDKLKDSSLGAGQGRDRTWARELLVAVEVALACVLMVGAGLLLRSFMRVIEIDPGFRPDQAIAWNLQPSRNFTTNTQATAYYQELVHDVEALPGVESAGLSDTLPLGRNRSWGVNAKGEATLDGKQIAQPGTANAFPRVVDTGYIHTMGIPLKAGRDFDRLDEVGGKKAVAVINETMARQLWPGKDAVGRVFGTGWTPDYEVIGVVGDVHHSALEETPSPEMYILGAQLSWSSEELVVRTKASPSVIAPTVRATLRRIDAGMPLENYQSLGEIVDHAVSPRRLIVILLGLFSGLSLLLASVGIYGVISYAISQRTSELGIRLALGATPGGILRLVLGDGMKPVALGLLLGLAGSLVVTRLAQSMLFGVSATDPWTFIANALLFVGVGLLACWIPARRAAKLEPMTALRAE